MQHAFGHVARGARSVGQQWSQHDVLRLARLECEQGVAPRACHHAAPRRHREPIIHKPLVRPVPPRACRKGLQRHQRAKYRAAAAGVLTISVALGVEGNAQQPCPLRCGMECEGRMVGRVECAPG